MEWRKWLAWTLAAGLFVGSLVSLFYWHPERDFVRSYRVAVGVAVSTRSDVRLGSGEVVHIRTPCRLEPGERYTLSERVQVDGVTEYVVLCMDEACRRVDPCAFR